MINLCFIARITLCAVSPGAEGRSHGLSSCYRRAIFLQDGGGNVVVDRGGK